MKLELPLYALTHLFNGEMLTAFFSPSPLKRRVQTPAARPQAGAGKPPPKGGCASTGAPAQYIFPSLGLASCCIDPVYGLYRAMDLTRELPTMWIHSFTGGEERVCVDRHRTVQLLGLGLS